MKNKNTFFDIKTSKTFVLTLFFVLLASNCFAQWKTAEANNIKNDIIITYEVTYDKELSADEKKSPEYISEITVTFDKDKLLERRFGDQNKASNTFFLYDYNTLKLYGCTSLETSKKGIQFNFLEPKGAFEVGIKTPKEFLGYSCEKATIRLNNIPKEIYFTKQIGLRYSRIYKVDGFLMQFPGYSKALGYYTVKAKKIAYDDLPDSFYSLEGYSIETLGEIKKQVLERKETLNEIRMNLIGKTANTFKEFNIKNEKIDTEKLSGDVIVYNFWFTTCAPCKAEIPKLNQLKAKYKNQNVHFISIALDPEYKIIPFLVTTPLDFEIIPDGQWIAEKFGVTAYPTNIIVDKKGIIQFCEMGYKSDIIERMTAALDKYLKQ